MSVGGGLPVFTGCSGLDISGGGIRLLHKNIFEINARLLLRIMIPRLSEKRCLEVSGTVIRAWKDEDLKMYKVAVQFTDISRSQQDLIVRYTFMKMSEQRRLIELPGHY